MLLAPAHLHSTRADFLRRFGRSAGARNERALALTENERERAFLRARLAALDGSG